MLNPDLVRRWERLIAIRDEVNRALEVARQDKVIGNSLGARVTVRARGAAAQLLEPMRDDLAMLFIVSQLEFERGSGDGPDVEVSVSRAEGEKCARCWRIVPATSQQSDTAGLCDRCVAATAGQHAAWRSERRRRPAAPHPAMPSADAVGAPADRRQWGRGTLVRAAVRVRDHRGHRGPRPDHQGAAAKLAGVRREPDADPRTARSDPRAEHRRGVRLTELGGLPVQARRHARGRVAGAGGDRTLRHAARVPGSPGAGRPGADSRRRLRQPARSHHPRPCRGFRGRLLGGLG